MQLLPLPAVLGDFILLLKSMEGFVALRGKWTYLRTHSRKMEWLRLELRPPDSSADLLCTTQVILGYPTVTRGDHGHPSEGSDTLAEALGPCMS